MGSLLKNGINYSQGDTFNGVPIGTISSYISNVIPPGWLLLDGSIYNKTDFIELYYRIPENWKIGNDKFQLPDLRDKFVQGANGNLGSTIEAGLPDIKGELNIGGSGPALIGAFYKNGAQTGEKGGDGGTDAHGYFQASLGETKIDGTYKTEDDYKIYGKSDTVQPPAVTLNYIIKATNFIEFTNNKLLDDERMTNANVLSAMKILSMVDSVFETGENENGNWLKLKNGLIMCWGSIEMGSNLTNGGTWNDNVILPITYTNKPKIIATPESSSGAGQELRIVNITISNFDFSLYNRATSGSMILPILNWFAIGK